MSHTVKTYINNDSWQEADWVSMIKFLFTSLPLYKNCGTYVQLPKYRISSVIRRSFFLPKQSQRSRSVLKDGSRSLGSFRKGKIGIIAKF